MIPPKIKEAIEANPELNEQLLANGLGLDWKKFNRTVFEFIARRINRKVTLRAVETPALITEKLILGKDQLQSQLFDKKLAHEDDLALHLGQQKRPFNWVSGKTLHSYWNKGQAKDTKLNVLLVYLEVEQAAWDDWKKLQAQTNLKNLASRLSRKSSQQDLIKNYYQGSYYLYYQKTDNSQNLVKAPFIIALDDRGQVYAETITEGHPYRSHLIEIRDGILYIHCENQLFDEKENHLFNVGNETKPEVLFGVSNTTSVTKKLAIGIRNVLVKQKENFTQETFMETEIPLNATSKNKNEDSVVVRHFLKQRVNLIHSQNCCSLEALRETVE